MSASDLNVPASPEQLDYLLRRAEQESIAAVRSIDPRVAEPHARMASAFSARALSLLGEPAVQGIAANLTAEDASRTF